MARGTPINQRRLSQVMLQLKDFKDAMQRLWEEAYLYPTWPRTLTYVLGATGRRLGEALALATTDIDFEARRITWRIEKKRGEFYLTLPASDRLLKLLRRYIALGGVSHKLFDVSKQRASYKVKKTLEELGLRGWTAHDLRHAWILLALLETKSLELVRRWVAHSDYELLAYYSRTVGLEMERPLVEL
ncbi:tyrosine-type recombinase/integrase [Pyrobaculum sp. 3827-6]|uniref:tyrosine-type recombinase/integrase n=1 Tax=Pyrobaculum sp. 3827-6 TaxID=2983604 RepID=UPI0021D7D2A5|nr:tyrosine-type recombinase/integrase [Pyrobaculum sp. 3827-6]MCU7787099.1 tyrosine-type recombinase/integrase [Pyrobaculum sp. 3827-6]